MYVYIVKKYKQAQYRAYLETLKMAKDTRLMELLDKELNALKDLHAYKELLEKVQNNKFVDRVRLITQIDQHIGIIQERIFNSVFSSSADGVDTKNINYTSEVIDSLAAAYEGREFQNSLSRLCEIAEMHRRYLIETNGSNTDKLINGRVNQMAVKYGLLSTEIIKEESKDAAPNYHRIEFGQKLGKVSAHIATDASLRMIYADNMLKGVGKEEMFKIASELVNTHLAFGWSERFNQQEIGGVHKVAEFYEILSAKENAKEKAAMSPELFDLVKAVAELDNLRTECIGYRLNHIVNPVLLIKLDIESAEKQQPEDEPNYIYPNDLCVMLVAASKYLLENKSTDSQYAMPEVTKMYNLLLHQAGYYEMLANLASGEDADDKFDILLAYIRKPEFGGEFNDVDKAELKKLLQIVDEACYLFNPVKMPKKEEIVLDMNVVESFRLHVAHDIKYDTEQYLACMSESGGYIEESDAKVVSEYLLQCNLTLTEQQQKFLTSGEPFDQEWVDLKVFELDDRFSGKIMDYFIKNDISDDVVEKIVDLDDDDRFKNFNDIDLAVKHILLGDWKDGLKDDDLKKISIPVLNRLIKVNLSNPYASGIDRLQRDIKEFSSDENIQTYFEAFTVSRFNYIKKAEVLIDTLKQKIEDGKLPGLRLEYTQQYMAALLEHVDLSKKIFFPFENFENLTDETSVKERVVKWLNEEVDDLDQVFADMAAQIDSPEFKKSLHDVARMGLLFKSKSWNLDITKHSNPADDADILNARLANEYVLWGEELSKISKDTDYNDMTKDLVKVLAENSRVILSEASELDRVYYALYSAINPVNIYGVMAGMPSQEPYIKLVAMYTHAQEILMWRLNAGLDLEVDDKIKSLVALVLEYYTNVPGSGDFNQNLKKIIEDNLERTTGKKPDANVKKVVDNIVDSFERVRVMYKESLYNFFALDEVNVAGVEFDPSLMFNNYLDTIQQNDTNMPYEDVNVLVKHLVANKILLSEKAKDTLVAQVKKQNPGVLGNLTRMIVGDYLAAAVKAIKTPEIVRNELEGQEERENVYASDLARIADLSKLIDDGKKTFDEYNALYQQEIMNYKFSGEIQKKFSALDRFQPVYEKIQEGLSSLEKDLQSSQKQRSAEAKSKELSVEEKAKSHNRMVDIGQKLGALLDKFELVQRIFDPTHHGRDLNVYQNPENTVAATSKNTKAKHISSTGTVVRQAGSIDLDAGAPSLAPRNIGGALHVEEDDNDDVNSSSSGAEENIPVTKSKPQWFNVRGLNPFRKGNNNAPLVPNDDEESEDGLNSRISSGSYNPASPRRLSSESDASSGISFGLGAIDDDNSSEDSLNMSKMTDDLMLYITTKMLPSTYDTKEDLISAVDKLAEEISEHQKNRANSADKLALGNQLGTMLDLVEFIREPKDRKRHLASASTQKRVMDAQIQFEKDCAKIEAMLQVLGDGEPFPANMQQMFLDVNAQITSSQGNRLKIKDEIKQDEFHFKALIEQQIKKLSELQDDLLEVYDAQDKPEENPSIHFFAPPKGKISASQWQKIKDGIKENVDEINTAARAPTKKARVAGPTVPAANSFEYKEDNAGNTVIVKETKFPLNEVKVDYNQTEHTITAVVPGVWLKDLKNVDAKHKEMIAGFVKVISDAVPGSTIVIGNCEYHPKVAKYLRDLVVAQNKDLKIDYDPKTKSVLNKKRSWPWHHH